MFLFPIFFPVDSNRGNRVVYAFVFLSAAGIFRSSVHFQWKWSHSGNGQRVRHSRDSDSGVDICVSIHSRTNEYHKPVFPSLARAIEKEANSSFYAYVNGDILLSSSVIPVLQILHQRLKWALFKNGVLLCGRVNEVKEVHILTSSKEAYRDSFESSYSTGKRRNPYSAVVYYCVVSSVGLLHLCWKALHCDGTWSCKCGAGSLLYRQLDHGKHQP